MLVCNHTSPLSHGQGILPQCEIGRRRYREGCASAGGRRGAARGEDMIQISTLLKPERGWMRLPACVLLGCAILVGSAGRGVPAPQGDEERPGYVPTEAEEQLP